MKKTVFTTAAAAIMAGLGMVSSPSAQQVIEQVVQNGDGVEIAQKQAVNKSGARSQQANSRSQSVRNNNVTNPYAPLGGAPYYGGGVVTECPPNSTANG